MKFRTKLPISPYPQQIRLGNKLITIGSCFSQNIGDRLNTYKFDCLTNPFGTIYDPISISRLIQLSLDQTLPDNNTYVKSDGVYKNLFFHSSLNGLSSDELELKIKAKLGQLKNYLDNAQWLMITFGTAHVYRHTETNELVANCQKLPAKYFTKELATPDQLAASFERMYLGLTKLNPKLRIILTVSPVRHLRDGLVENNLSKSILRLFAHQLSSSHENVYYYPAYELQLDELRDYRYYKEDMIHPTDQATEYIWNNFVMSFFDKQAADFLNVWQKVISALSHKPFNPTTQEHQSFLAKTLQQLVKLGEVVDTEKEIALIRDQIL